MENTTKQIETVAIPKELHEKIENRHERKNEIIDFIKNAQEKRDECKDKDTLNKINLNLDMAIFKLICELDELLADVEYGTVE
jgi:hypothetical protein